MGIGKSNTANLPLNLAVQPRDAEGAGETRQAVMVIHQLYCLWRPCNGEFTYWFVPHQE